MTNVALIATPPAPVAAKFEFDAAFQSKIAALSVRDAAFNERTEGLVHPDQFSNVAEAVLVDIALKYYEKYRRQPDGVSLMRLILERIAKKQIRKDLVPEVKSAVRAVLKADIGDRDFVIDEVGEFAKHQAIESAVLKTAEILSQRRFPEIEEIMKKAFDVGASEDGGEYDYFEEIASRTQERIDLAAGLIKPHGVSTGVSAIDSRLYHKGWGKRELSILMGGAKAGKTTALINFARNAAMNKENVLYITLEVSKKVVGDRMDAGFADIAMKLVGDSPHEINTKIKALQTNCGVIKLHEFPTGTMRPSDLRRLLSRYRAKGLKFDLVVVDYLDIMCPENRYNDEIANSKSIWVDVRAIAQQEDVAMLSATQTNRDGFKASVAKAEHVADDFNKIRIADIVISINATEEERAKGEARLYFAASRNQEGGFSVFIKQDLAKMKFVTKVIRIE